MTLFRLTFHECDGAVPDPGVVVDVAGISAARLAAIERARDIMAAEVQRGKLCLSCWIVISDDNGHNIDTLQFGDAIEMIAPPACGHQTKEEALHVGH